MQELAERRAVPRSRLVNWPVARVQGVGEVRLIDLSVAGAQIQHLHPLSPGVACVLDLPSAIGALSLSAAVVWCTVIGQKRNVGGDSHLVARSGLRFMTLTAVQQDALEVTLRDLVPARRPIV